MCSEFIYIYSCLMWLLIVRMCNNTGYSVQAHVTDSTRFEKPPVKASIIYDYKNLYFVLLWFARKCHSLPLPWEKRLQTNNVIKFLFEMYIDTYSHESSRILLLCFMILCDSIIHLTIVILQNKPTFGI